MLCKVLLSFSPYTNVISFSFQDNFPVSGAICILLVCNLRWEEGSMGQGYLQLGNKAGTGSFSLSLQNPVSTTWPIVSACARSCRKFVSSLWLASYNNSARPLCISWRVLQWYIHRHSRNSVVGTYEKVNDVSLMDYFE